MINFTEAKDFLEICIIFGGGVALLVGGFRRGGRQELLGALNEARAVNSAHDVRIKALEHDKRDLEAKMQERETFYQGQMSTLTKELEAARDELKNLRDMVMFNKLPPVLQEALDGKHAEVVDKLNDLQAEVSTITIDVAAINKEVRKRGKRPVKPTTASPISA